MCCIWHIFMYVSTFAKEVMRQLAFRPWLQTKIGKVYWRLEKCQDTFRALPRYHLSTQTPNSQGNCWGRLFTVTSRSMHVPKASCVCSTLHVIVTVEYVSSFTHCGINKIDTFFFFFVIVFSCLCCCMAANYVSACRGRHSTYKSSVNNNTLTGNTIISTDPEASSELYDAFLFLQVTYSWNPGFTDKSDNWEKTLSTSLTLKIHQIIAWVLNKRVIDPQIHHFKYK